MINVLQLVDSLSLGGTERVAVNIANHLPGAQYKSFLCATRKEGPLVERIAPHVNYLFLRRKSRFDISAIYRLLRWVKKNDIEVIHAHSSSVFLACAVKWIIPSVKIIWHDHYGALSVKKRPAQLLRSVMNGVSGIISVNQALQQWAISQLGYPEKHIWFLKNFVVAEKSNDESLVLPGEPGKRLVCIANFRPQKDQITLLHAMYTVCQKDPNVHLFLVGDAVDPNYAEKVLNLIEALGLQRNVHNLGRQDDVRNVLQSCDIGILSSVSEGLPLSLLEYGQEKLAVIATRVGDIPVVLGNGEFGLLVEPRSAKQLSEAIIRMVSCKNDQEQYGQKFFNHIRENYSVDTAISRLASIYETVLEIK